MNSAIIANLQVNENLINVLEFTVDACDQQQVEGDVAAAKYLPLQGLIHHIFIQLYALSLKMTLPLSFYKMYK